MAEDRKVKLTGEVELKHGDMTAVLEELRAFNEGWQKSAAHLEKVIAHLTGTKQQMSSTETAAEGTAEAVAGVAEAAEETSVAVKNAATSTQQTEKAAKQLSATQERAAARAKEWAAAEQRHAAIMRALQNPKDAAAQKAMKVALDEMAARDKLNRQYKVTVAEALKVNDAIGKTEKGTKRASAAATALKSVWTGIWQGVGLGGVLSIAGAIGGVIGWLKQGITEASKFDAVFEKMAARGVENVRELEVAVIELAGSLGEKSLDVATTVDLAEKLGAGAESINVAAAAWQNYQMHGMDANRTIEISTRLVKAFNVPVREQSELIEQVALASQQAHVSQEMLWQGMSSMAPMMKQIGGSWKDLLNITKMAAAGGIKVEEEGPAGLRELFSQLINMSDELAQKLVQLGVVQTDSGDKWKGLTDLVEAQKGQFEDLNEEIKSYQKQAQEIGLLTTQAERQIQQYERLDAVKKSGERMNRAERQSYRELRREMRDMSKELSAYDRAGDLVENGEFRRLSTVDQLRERIRAAKEAQADLNQESDWAKLKADELGESINRNEQLIHSFAETLRTEVKQALNELVGEKGAAAVVAELGKYPEVLKGFTAEVKTLVAAITGEVAKGSSGAQAAISGLDGQVKLLHASGTDAIARLVASFSTMRTALLGPVAEAMNAVAQLILNKMNEPFGPDNQTLFGAISAWAAKVGATMIVDLESFFNGDITLGQLLEKWFRAAVDVMTPHIVTAFETMAGAVWDAFWDELYRQATTANPSEIVKTVQGWFQPITDFAYGNPGLDEVLDPRAMAGGAASFAPTPAMPTKSAGMSMAPSQVAKTVNTGGHVFHISNPDPTAVSNQVIKDLRQHERMGTMKMGAI